MTPTQKELIDYLLEGMYLMQKVRANGSSAYKVYKGNQIPVRYFSTDTVAFLRNGLLKTDKRRRMTLNLSRVRMLHGGSWIKKRYYSLKSK